MISRKSKAMCFFLAFVLVISFLPASSYGIEFRDDSYAFPSNIEISEHEPSIPTKDQLDNAAPNQLIVSFKGTALDVDEKVEVAELEGESLEGIPDKVPSKQITLSELGATSLEELNKDEGNPSASACSLLTFKDGVDLRQTSAILLSSNYVNAVQPNFIYELFDSDAHDISLNLATESLLKAANDPYLVNKSSGLNQQYLYTTKVTDAWSKGYRTNGKVSVAVIDSGPRLDHPDLRSAWDLDHARDFSTTSPSIYGIEYNDNPARWAGKTEYECHGTWVSGIIAAAANNGVGIAGTSYNAKVIPLKVTDGKTFYTSTLVRAYKYLDNEIESGNLDDLKVINLSMGGQESDSLLKSEISHMTKSHNVLTVAAAGNYGNSKHVYPADYSDVLSVMAVNQSNTRASFSCYGGKDVSAPGTNITTTIPWNSSGNAGYSKDGINGTSFSTPIVSGVAAICYALKPSARADEVKESIISGATSLSSKDKTCAPMINALQAAKNVLSGKGLYEATHISISKAKVSAISSKIYSGKLKKPTPKVTMNGKKLTRGIDYTLSYSGNRNPGKATIKIKAKGLYKDYKNVTFKIIPKASKVLKVKPGYRSFTVKWKTQKKCSSGYQIRYSTSSKRHSSKKLKKGKSVRVVGKSKYSKTIKGLKSKKRYYVQIRAYKKAKGTYYYSKWSSSKKVRTR